MVLPILPIGLKENLSEQDHNPFFQSENFIYHHLGNYIDPLPSGTLLSLNSSKLEPSIQVLSNVTLPSQPPHASECLWVKILKSIPKSAAQEFFPYKDGFSLAWVTLSDSGSKNLRQDESGPAIGRLIRNKLKICFEQGFILPDNAQALKAKLIHLALRDQYDLIITTGGTGLTSRDITPQATAQVLDYQLPGFVQAMMAESLKKTSRAILSRAVAGVLEKSLILNLPGSQKAVSENLSAILEALPHALDKLHDDPSPCGG
ncbi:MAG: MogA/MoaB family molybdenum cofactor biosynthesis protein [Desulfovibrionaceae bacterium]|nr:MogA/MoaB family molybdenum cofactor biosynthesis protein [Desulfovibrionaceae bacterium]